MVETKKVRLLVSGRVQGVWYRSWAVQQAEELGVDGWVRNRHDGLVEAVVAGPAAQVDAMIERMRGGPPMARVDGIEQTPESESVGPGFEQRSTV